MPAVAVTDANNLCGFVRFYKGAIAAGIKPICGADVVVEADGELEKNYRLTLLAMSNKGYKNIIEIISKGYQLGQFEGKPIVQRAWIETHQEDVLILSGALHGDIGIYLDAHKMLQAKQSLERWMQVFPNRFYIELQRTNRVGESEYIHAVVPLAVELNCPVVATNDVRFLKREDFEAHEARVCIHDGVTIDDPRRKKTLFRRAIP